MAKMEGFVDGVNSFLDGGIEKVREGTQYLQSAVGKKAQEKEKMEVERKDIMLRKKPKKLRKFEVLPARVDKFDQLLTDRGLERGSTTLISGGAGTGKTTFCLQSIYYGALHGEKGVFISFEEEPVKIRQHMKKNFGWDFVELERKGLVAIIKLDPSKIARMVEGTLAKESGILKIEIKQIKLPIKPDRVCFDSLSALSIAFTDEGNYRKYLRELFEMIETYNSVNFAISETEQNPQKYSRTGVEEFLADGVIVFYNLKVDGKRETALEILKLRSGKHVKKMVPYKLGPKGVEILFKGLEKKA